MKAEWPQSRRLRVDQALNGGHNCAKRVGRAEKGGCKQTKSDEGPMGGEVYQKRACMRESACKLPPVKPQASRASLRFGTPQRPSTVS